MKHSATEGSHPTPDWHLIPVEKEPPTYGLYIWPAVFVGVAATLFGFFWR